MKVKVKVKSQESLLSIGYPFNTNSDDLFNLLSGKTLTVDTMNIINVNGGKIYISDEYPEHAIYDYLVDSIQNPEHIFSKQEYEFSTKEILDMIGNNCRMRSKQVVDYTVNKAMSKIREIIEDKGLVDEFKEVLI